MTKYLLIAAAALIVLLGLSTWQYRRMYVATEFALTTQNDAIKARNEEASRKLKTMTEARDAEQTRYNEAKAEAKRKDDDFNRVLAQLRDAVAPDRPAPVTRVRVQACDAGGGGGSAKGAVPAGGPKGKGANSSASGVLSAGSARRLEQRLIEIEELSRDFNACQADLLAR